MKIDSFVREDAIDLIANLLDPVSRILAVEKTKEVFETKTVIEIAVYILKNFKQEALEIVCVINGEDPQKWKFTAYDVINTLTEVLNNPQIMEVFGLRSQKEESDSSGSATEITEEGGR